MSNLSDKWRRRDTLPRTDWEQLRRLKGLSRTEQAPLLEVLSGRYWGPIFQFLLCRGHADSEAEDLIQDFFAFALESGLFEKADESRGRFRSFLLRSLSHFVANEQRKQSARKRRPELGVASLDELVDDGYFQPGALVDADTPDSLFHRAWVREVVRNVVRMMEQEFRSTGKASHYVLFESRILLPELEGVDPPPLREQAEALGLEVKEAANQIATAKRGFRRLLAKEVRSYVASEIDASAEEGDVLRLLGLEGVG